MSFPDIGFRVKCWVQKIIYGYSGEETWELPHFTTLYMLPRLKALRARGTMGFPAELLPVGFAETEGVEQADEDAIYKKAAEDWHTVIDKIIRSMEAYVDCEDMFEFDNTEEYEEGWRLFGKYFLALWD